MIIPTKNTLVFESSALDIRNYWDDEAKAGADNRNASSFLTGSVNSKAWKEIFKSVAISSKLSSLSVEMIILSTLRGIKGNITKPKFITGVKGKLPLKITQDLHS